MAKGQFCDLHMYSYLVMPPFVTKACSTVYIIIILNNCETAIDCSQKWKEHHVESGKTVIVVKIFLCL